MSGKSFPEDEGESLTNEREKDRGVGIGGQRKWSLCFMTITVSWNKLKGFGQRV